MNMDRKVVVSLQKDSLELEGYSTNILYDVGNGLQSFFEADDDTKSFALLVHYLSVQNISNQKKYNERTVILQGKYLMKDENTVREHLEKHGSCTGLDNWNAYTKASGTEVFELIDKVKLGIDKLADGACPLYFTNGEDVILLNQSASSEKEGKVLDTVLDIVMNTLEKEQTESLENPKSM